MKMAVEVTERGEKSHRLTQMNADQKTTDLKKVS